MIHHGRECQVMTNSPTYDKQQTLDDYWEQIGGLLFRVYAKPRYFLD